jgi:hypothetical protein
MLYTNYTRNLRARLNKLACFENTATADFSTVVSCGLKLLMV